MELAKETDCTNTMQVAMGEALPIVPIAFSYPSLDMTACIQEGSSKKSEGDPEDSEQ